MHTTQSSCSVAPFPADGLANAGAVTGAEPVGADGCGMCAVEDAIEVGSIGSGKGAAVHLPATDDGGAAGSGSAT